MRISDWSSDVCSSDLSVAFITSPSPKRYFVARVTWIGYFCLGVCLASRIAKKIFGNSLPEAVNGAQQPPSSYHSRHLAPATHTMQTTFLALCLLLALSTAAAFLQPSGAFQMRSFALQAKASKASDSSEVRWEVCGRLCGKGLSILLVIFSLCCFGVCSLMLD